MKQQQYLEFIKKNNIDSPHYVAYLLPLLLVGIPLIWENVCWIPIVQIALIIAFKCCQKKYQNRLNIFSDYVDTMVQNVERNTFHITSRMQVGLAVFSDSGKLQWRNQYFDKIVDDSHLAGKSIEAILPLQENSFKSICAKDETTRIFELQGKTYSMQTRRMLDEDAKPAPGEQPALEGVAVYLYDITELAEIKKKYADEKLALMYIRCDNYEEVIRSLSDSGLIALNGALSGMITKWAEKHNGFCIHISNNFAVLGFRHKDLIEIINNKFEILDGVHGINTGGHMNPTLSIGVATAGDTLNEQLNNADRALDNALNRGGDQAVIDNGGHFSYYGAKGTVSSKANRVRARIVAKTFREKLEQAGNIIVMGHTQEDFDAVGAAMGVAVMAKFLNKPVHIAMGKFTREMQQSKKILCNTADSEYLNELIVVGKENVLNLVKPNTLLVLVDHHRKLLASVPELLDKVEQKIIIDHHRRCEDIITDTVLVYQEPTSSSTSEMVAELFPYFDEDVKPGKLEASYLYAGICLDSKQFTVQTSERTFAVAAMLKATGISQDTINRLFADSWDDNQYRAKLLAEAQIIAPCFAMALNRDAEKTPHNNILASQVADKLITILDVHGACTVSEYSDGTIGINARSDGTIFNVQIMMEALGGGGHQNVAACQLESKTVAEAVALLQEEIKKQMED